MASLPVVAPSPTRSENAASGQRRPRRAIRLGWTEHEISWISSPSMPRFLCTLLALSTIEIPFLPWVGSIIDFSIIDFLHAYSW
jgi:hypothetical protein